LHEPIRSRPTRAWWRSIGSRFWCCHRCSSGWRAGSRPRCGDRRGNRNIWWSRYYTATPTGHLLRLPGLWLSCLRISGLCPAGLRISGLLGLPCLLRASGLWIPRLLGTARSPRSPKLRILRRRGKSRLFCSPRIWIPPVIQDTRLIPAMRHLGTRTARHTPPIPVPATDTPCMATPGDRASEDAPGVEYSIEPSG
jgi:hypothetical protein